MAISVGSQAGLRLLNTLFGRKSTRKFGFTNSFSFSTGSFTLDAFSSTSSNQILKLTVQKMQAAINRPLPAIRLNGAGAQAAAFSNAAAAPQPYTPTQQEIEAGVAAAGGREALDPWLVDGKTKLDINGRKIVAQVGGSSGEAEAAGAAKSQSDLRNAVVSSISRFGLDAKSLDGGADSLRESLKAAANTLSKEQPNLALAIEYALEDAFAAISAWEGSSSGTPAVDYEKQRETNLKQAADIASQLNLGDGEGWGITSLAEDLAVFGMDMTAMAKNPYDLAESIRGKSREMLDALDAKYVGTEAEYIAERNRITGASARLVNGLEGSGAAMAMASMSLTGVSASANVSVSVGGTTIDAASVIAVGNVIVDPLVLDLNGDGIDLKGADEGTEFDMTGNGEKNAMGFIRGDDALLFLDLYGDGVVRDGRQLFGNNDGHANGFEALRAYDDNGDGVIDENDAIYEKLMVWQEKTEDGVCEKDETMTLREAGIASINLGYQNVREDDGKGNLIGQTGSFTRDDGSEGYAADVWFHEKK